MLIRHFFIPQTVFDIEGDERASLYLEFQDSCPILTKGLSTHPRDDVVNVTRYVEAEMWTGPKMTGLTVPIKCDFLFVSKIFKSQAWKF